MGEKAKKVIRPLDETMSENPKCHLHIPQPRNDIYVLNIIFFNILEKIRNEGKRPLRNTQNPNALARVHKLDGGQNFEGNAKDAHLWG